MSSDGSVDPNHTMVVISAVDKWSALKSMLQTSCEEDSHRVTFSSEGPNHVCSVEVEGRLIRLLYADLQEDMSEESVCGAAEGCFRSCSGGLCSFLLLIQGGSFTPRERRLTEIFQVHFGAEMLQHLVILSAEDGEVVDTLDDSLLELINTCNGRYCCITSATVTGGLLSVLEMVSCTAGAGYTEAMLREAKRRCTEDSAMNMLKQKVNEAEDRQKVFREFVQKQESRRSKEAEELKVKHAEERRKEAAEERKHQEKRESLQEAVSSHISSLQLQVTSPTDDPAEVTSVVLLGLSGSGKSSALNLILSRASGQYLACGLTHQPSGSTVSCERRDVQAAGRRLALVDTPELWDEDGAENLQLVKDCLALALPGPHVFLLVLQVGRFTQGELNMLGHMQKVFGREVAEHSIVLFIHSDGTQARPPNIADHVAAAHPSLQDLIRRCGSRYHDLNITSSRSALSYPQVKELLAGIGKLAAAHGGRAFPVKKFSAEELQQRSRDMTQRRDEALEVNHLLRGE